MTQTSHTVGIEVEFLGRQSVHPVLSNLRGSDRESLRNVVDERRSYNTTFHDDRWVLGYDGSVDWEIKSHPLRDTEDVRHVYAAIRASGGRVDSRCGTHVHVGIGHFTSRQVARLAKLWLRYELALDQLQPRSRRASRNGYCMSVYTQAPYCDRAPREGFDLTAAFSEIDAADRSGATVGDVRQVVQRGRTSKLNLQSFERIGTVEFRGAAGTLNFRKIDSWISLLCAICRKAEDHQTVVRPSVATFEEMLAELLPQTVPTLREAAQREPRVGSVASTCWAWLDKHREFDEAATRLERGVPTIGVGIPDGFGDPPRGVYNFSDPQGDEQCSATSIKDGKQQLLVGWLLQQVPTASRGTARNAVSRWAANRGISARPSHSTNSLAAYLRRRRDSLAARDQRLGLSR